MMMRGVTFVLALKNLWKQKETQALHSGSALIENNWEEAPDNNKIRLLYPTIAYGDNNGAASYNFTYLA